jgi:hypothetical protein
VGKPEGKRPLGDPGVEEDTIKMFLQELGCRGTYWIVPARDRDRWWALVNPATNLRVPLNAGNFLSS